MAISISLLHNDIRSQIKKHNSAFVSPSDIDFAINKSQYDVLDLIIAEYESGGKRSSADQDLLKLHLFSGTAEERSLPSDVYKLSTVFLSDSEGDILDDKRFNDRLNSIIIPPSASRPIATVYNDGASKIRIVPSASTHRIKYWIVPVVAKYNFTQTDGVITYNPTGSVDVGFPMSEYTKILNRTLFYLGIPSVNADVANLEKQA
jgi:hypothetical protein